MQYHGDCQPPKHLCKTPHLNRETMSRQTGIWSRLGSIERPAPFVFGVYKPNGAPQKPTQSAFRSAPSINSAHNQKKKQQPHHAHRSSSLRCHRCRRAAAGAARAARRPGARLRQPELRVPIQRAQLSRGVSAQLQRPVLPDGVPKCAHAGVVHYNNQHDHHDHHHHDDAAAPAPLRFGRTNKMRVWKYEWRSLSRGVLVFASVCGSGEERILRFLKIDWMIACHKIYQILRLYIVLSVVELRKNGK